MNTDPLADLVLSMVVLFLVFCWLVVLPTVGLLYMVGMMR